MANMPADTPLEDGKPINDLESAKFTKDKDGHGQVDVVQPTAKLIGLTKEQLEEYRNDPFWKAVRYTLFIAFWLVWLAMFVGAVLIVVMSPKCSELKWQDKMVAYKIFTLAFKDSDSTLDSNAGLGDFMGIKEKLGALKESGVNTIWPSPVLAYDKNLMTPNSIVKLEVAEQLGGPEKFKELVKDVHAKDMKILVDLPLTVVANTDNWVQQMNISDGISGPKNGIDNKVSALNLKNQNVREALLGLAKKFVEWGIDGINLADAGLVKDAADLNALAKSIREMHGAAHIQIYSDKDLDLGEQSHQILPLIGDKKEADLPGMVQQLHANLAMVGKQSDPKLRQPTEPEQPSNGNGASSPSPANNKTKTVWRLGSLENGRLDTLLDSSLNSAQKRQLSSLFSLVQLFIPGPVSILYGEELGLLSGNSSGGAKQPSLVVFPWDAGTLAAAKRKDQFFLLPGDAGAQDDYASQSQKDSEYSPLANFKKFAKLRQNNDFLSGHFSRVDFANKELGIYLVKRGPPATSGFYALVVNWSGRQQPDEVDLGLLLAEQLKETEDKKLTLLASTANIEGQEAAGTGKTMRAKVQVPAYGAVLVQGQ